MRFLEGWGRGPRNSRLDFGGYLDPLPPFCLNFLPQWIFNRIAVVYYYSPGSSISIGEGMSSTQRSLVINNSDNVMYDGSTSLRSELDSFILSL